MWAGQTGNRDVVPAAAHNFLFSAAFKSTLGPTGWRESTWGQSGRRESLTSHFYLVSSLDIQMRGAVPLFRMPVDGVPLAQFMFMFTIPLTRVQGLLKPIRGAGEKIRNRPDHSESACSRH